MTTTSPSKKSYFTFGQGHVHQIDNACFNKDIVVEVDGTDLQTPRDRMFEHFGKQWSMEYNELPDMAYFPRGWVNLDEALKNGTI
jgi:hypothetical protein